MPASAAALSTSSSRLAIALCEVAATPTRLPAASSSQISRAPVQVLPEPGGPWMNSAEPPRLATRSPSVLAAQPRRHPQQQLERRVGPEIEPVACSASARSAACWAVCGIGLAGISAVGSGL